MATKAELEVTVAALTADMAAMEKRMDRSVLLITRLLRRSSVVAPTTVPRDEYDAALLELRGNNAESTERFPVDTIVRKALDRRVGVAFESVRQVLARIDQAEASKAG
jgi:hypothetical protein